MEKKRVLITGGTGFVGRHLTLRLILAGHQVYLLTRDASRQNLFQTQESRIQVLEANLLDPTDVYRVVKEVKPELVYHLASTPFNPPTISPEAHIKVIVMGTFNLLEALTERPEVRIICTGSAAEYGSGSDLQEASPLAPATILGAAKAAAGILVQTYARLHNMHTVLLRLFTPYGPGDHPGRLIPYTILSALRRHDVHLSNGQQQRDFLYIDDVIDAMLLSADKPLQPGATLNICSETGISVLHVAKKILDMMGNPVALLVGALPTRKDEIWKSSGDNSAARKSLDWRPRVGLEEGLIKTISSFTQHPHDIPL